MRSLILTLAVLAGPVGAAGPYDGLYRPDFDWAQGWDCQNIGSDGGALAIRDDTFFGVESACRLTNPVQVRDLPATLYDAQCSAEGETYNERIMLMTVAEGVAVSRIGGVSILRSCAQR